MLRKLFYMLVAWWWRRKVAKLTDTGEASRDLARAVKRQRTATMAALTVGARRCCGEPLLGMVRAHRTRPDFEVGCPVCGCRARGGPSPEDAVREWNKLCDARGL